MEVSPKDRGKRHYWGCDRRDYGFYESEDKSNGRMYVKEYEDRYNKGHSTDIHNVIRYDTIKHEDDPVSRSEHMIENLKRKKKFRITKSIEIHLPSVAKLTK
jgi:hypothetical protein